MGCLGLIGLRYCVLVPFLAANVYADKTWHPALEDSAHVFTPWRREHRRGVDQSARLSLLPGEARSPPPGGPPGTPVRLVAARAWACTSLRWLHRGPPACGVEFAVRGATPLPAAADCPHPAPTPSGRRHAPAAHLLSSAAAPAAVVLGAAYVLTSPVAARSSLLRRVATIRVLERRAADVLRRQAGAAREEAPALTADEAQAVARMRIAGGIGDAPRWVVTDFGHPRLGDAGAPMGERVDAQCERSRN